MDVTQLLAAWGWLLLAVSAFLAAVGLVGFGYQLAQRMRTGWRVRRSMRLLDTEWVAMQTTLRRVNEDGQ